MTARRSEESQAVLIAAARRALSRGHHLRALRFLSDARRLGPWTNDMESEARKIEDEALPTGSLKPAA
jgi:hypothetical protein